MPVGRPTQQTPINRKSQQKNGWIAKSYKLKKELVEQFAEACQKAGVSQAGQISTMMREFIEQNK